MASQVGSTSQALSAENRFKGAGIPARLPDGLLSSHKREMAKRSALSLEVHIRRLVTYHPMVSHKSFDGLSHIIPMASLKS